MIMQHNSNRINLSDPRHAVLSEAEERAVVTIMRRGGPNAKAAQDKLVNANMKFVVAVARQFIACGLPMDDLISEGAKGMVVAARKYNPIHTERFISYAVWWVRQAMLFALQTQVTTIRTPAMHVSKSELKKALKKGGQKRIDEARKRVEDLHRIRTPDSVEVLMEVGWEMVDQQANPAAGVEYQADQRQCARLLSILPPADRMILRRYFGLECGEGENLQEVGDRYGLTREAIRLRKAKALHRMQRVFEKECR